MVEDQYILGISAFFHDSAVALLKNGEIYFCAQEERYSRIKNDHSFPSMSIAAALTYAGIELRHINKIIFYDKPFLKFERILESALVAAPRGERRFYDSFVKSMQDKLGIRKYIHDCLNEIEIIKKNDYKLYFSEHHLSHAASAFYTSPFDESAILTIDGVGEHATCAISMASTDQIQVIEEMHYPHSIGLLYSAFTYFCGFKVNSGEYKLMGLAPYGSNASEVTRFKKKIYNEIVSIKEDSSIELNMEMFTFETKDLMIDELKWEKSFDLKVRRERDELSADYFHIAKAIQEVVEEILLGLLKRAKELTHQDNICLAGGVALNCVANSKLRNSRIFKSLWVHPAAGDAGGALGAALLLHYIDKEYKPLKHFDPYLGPEFDSSEVKKIERKYNIQFNELSYDELYKEVALELGNEKVVGWFQDRMEWGPRALGNRSILASTTHQEMQKKVNLKIKYREGFRPFAPILLEGSLEEIFVEQEFSPYMLFTYDMKEEHRRNLPDNWDELSISEKLIHPRSKYQAITHVDFSARVQTVSEKNNKKLFELLNTYKAKTGDPILINTSFNVRGEPIVCTPEDAFRCFMNTEMDVLVIQNYIIRKQSISDEIKNQWKRPTFDLD